MAVIQNAPRLMWQADRLGYAGRPERNVRDLSHVSVLVFAVTAMATGILACISLSSELGIGVTSSFVIVAVLFPLLCGWLAKERWYAKSLEDQIRSQEPNPELLQCVRDSDDDTPAGLLIVSQDMRIRFANQTYLDNTLHEREEVLGCKIQDLMLAEGFEDWTKALLKRSDPAASCCFSALIRVGLESKRLVHVTMVRIAPQQGEDRVLVVVEDLLQGCSLRPDVPVEGYTC